MVDVFLVHKERKEEVFGGAFGIFGMGGMQGGHGNGHGHHHHHPQTSIKRIDVTDAVKRLNSSLDDIKIVLRGVKMDGEEVKQQDLPIGKIDVITK